MIEDDGMDEEAEAVAVALLEVALSVKRKP